MKELITTERSDLFDVNMIIVIRTDISGNASREAIRSAFEKAVNAHEILNTRIILENGSAYYTDGASAQSLEFTEKTQAEIIADEEKRRFRLENGEYLRAFCMRHTEKGFSMLFCMHHLGGDGKSLIYFIGSFMEALSGKEPAYTQMVRLDPPVSRLLISHYNKKWKKERRVFDFDDLDKAYESYWNTHKTFVEEITFSAEQTADMLRSCKENEVRLTSYITAVMLKNSDGLCSVAYAADGRLDRNRAMGNQATGLSVDHRYKSGQSVWENAKTIHRMMHKKLDDPASKWFVLNFLAGFDPSLLDAMDLEAVGTYTSKTSRSLAKLMGYGEKKRDLSITNLTRLDIPDEYGGYHIENASFIPPVVSNGKNIVGIVTANGRMTVTLHTHEGTLSLAALLEGI